MNETLQVMLKVREGHYLDPAQSQHFASYYEQLPARIALMRRLEQGEREVIQGTIGYLQGRYLLETEVNAQIEVQLSFQYRSAANALLRDDLGELAVQAAFSASLCAQLGLPVGYRETAASSLCERTSRLLGKDWRTAEPYFTALNPGHLADWQSLQQAQAALTKAAHDKLLGELGDISGRPGLNHLLEYGWRRLLVAAALSGLANWSQPIDEVGGLVMNSWQQAGLEAPLLEQTLAALPALFAPLLSPELLARLKPWLARIVPHQGGLA